MTMRECVSELTSIRDDILEGTPEAQHAKGNPTARRQVELLLDPGLSGEVEQPRGHRAARFGLEAKKPHTDGVITGWGTVEGRTVFVSAHDCRIFGGAPGEAYATRIHKIMDVAIVGGAPQVSLNDGAGSRIQEGVSAFVGGAANVVFRRQIAGAVDPDAMRAQLVKKYKAEPMHPCYAAEQHGNPPT